LTAIAAPAELNGSRARGAAQPTTLYRHASDFQQKASHD